jgi:DNA-binding GntR family transcriptional regulator
MQRSLAEKSYQHIHAKLSRGELRPGMRLVNRSLANEIGVSVIPVREAIHRLASEGLIDYVPGSGAFVRRLGWRDLDELYVLRDALESCAAEEAARHITPALLEQLEAIVARMERIKDAICRRAAQLSTLDLLNEWLDEEERFHELLMDASHNSLLGRVIREHRAVSQVFDAQRHDPTILTAAIAQRTCKARRELLAALRSGDAATARRLMSEQIQLGRRTVYEHFQRQGRERP